MANINYCTSCQLPFKIYSKKQCRKCYLKQWKQNRKMKEMQSKKSAKQSTNGQSFRFFLDYRIFELGNFELQSGEVLINSHLAFKTFGTLNEKRDNVILFQTSFIGTHRNVEYFIGLGLDPTTHFIIIPNVFGNGLSTSPSTHASEKFPNISILDNVLAQYRLITQELKITSIKLVCGCSLGSFHAFQWASYFPDMVQNLLIWGGSCHSSKFNYIVLEGAKQAMVVDSQQSRAEISTQRSQDSLRSFSKVFSAYAFSPKFFRENMNQMPLHKLDIQQIHLIWENYFLAMNPRNLLSLIDTWQKADISANVRHNHDLPTSLKMIKAKCVILSSPHDMLFPQSDNEMYAQHIKDCEVVTLPSSWGHTSVLPGRSPPDEQLILQKMNELLNP